MPGIKITDEDRQNIDAKFICTLCKLLLYIPFQTICGHLMCQSCIENLLESSNPKCPEDGEELSKESVNRDRFKQRELNGICLHCPNPGCSWHSTYKQLEEHVGTTCDGVRVTCKYCRKENVLRKHERLSCDEAPVTCEFQAVGCSPDPTLKRKETRQHLFDKLIDHVRLLLQYILTFVSQLSNYIPRPEYIGIMQRIRDDITEVRFGLAEKFVMVVGKLTGLERRIESLESSGGDPRIRSELQELKSKVRDLTTECGNLRERNMSLEREMRDKNLIIDRLQSRMDQIDESLALESQRGLRAQQPIHSYNGTLLWKIEGYQRKRQDAINGVKTVLYSPPFYSAQYGYKMCAKIYMNGDGFGKGTHLSLFFVVMRGDYDALQTWPFVKKITIELLDQGNGDHMIDAFHSDPQSSSFQRPRSDMNIASGSPLFMPLDSLSGRQYIKDDVLFVKILVD